MYIWLYASPQHSFCLYFKPSFCCLLLITLIAKRESSSRPLSVVTLLILDGEGEEGVTTREIYGAIFLYAFHTHEKRMTVFRINTRKGDNGKDKFPILNADLVIHIYVYVLLKTCPKLYIRVNSLC